MCTCCPFFGKVDIHIIVHIQILLFDYQLNHDKDPLSNNLETVPLQIKTEQHSRFHHCFKLFRLSLLITVKRCFTKRLPLCGFILFFATKYRVGVSIPVLNVWAIYQWIALVKASRFYMLYWSWNSFVGKSRRVELGWILDVLPTFSILCVCLQKIIDPLLR